MNDAIVSIVVALITGLSVAIPTIVTTVTSNKAHDLVIDEKMKNMSTQVQSIDQKLDKFSDHEKDTMGRLIKVEESSKSAHHRIDGIVAQLNIHERRE